MRRGVGIYAGAMSDPTGADAVPVFESANAESPTTQSASSAQAWLAGFAEVIGSPRPDAQTAEALLELAGEAAHDSERLAAPLACWMVGVAGVDPSEALDRARQYVASRAG